ncbi:30S ribosomal protein S13 [Striga asiatica]|uniref:30S ribosomal protein S13 n=1 Tax=Striga asiatica TaxID=4170 RepID=A0A5A7P4E9_STRAF|nr:30S ribosomal protein S13 [Striga asiatica]
MAKLEEGFRNFFVQVLENVRERSAYSGGGNVVFDSNFLLQFSTVGGGGEKELGGGTAACQLNAQPTSSCHFRYISAFSTEEGAFQFRLPPNICSFLFVAYTYSVEWDLRSEINKSQLLNIERMGVGGRPRIGPMSEYCVDSLRGMKGIPENVLVPVGARWGPRHARERDLPPDPTATTVDHSKPVPLRIIEYVP